jgi:hypothetical protein
VLQFCVARLARRAVVWLGLTDLEHSDALGGRGRDLHENHAVVVVDADRAVRGATSKTRPTWTMPDVDPFADDDEAAAAADPPLDPLDDHRRVLRPGVGPGSTVRSAEIQRHGGAGAPRVAE